MEGVLVLVPVHYIGAHERLQPRDESQRKAILVLKNEGKGTIGLL